MHIFASSCLKDNLLVHLRSLSLEHTGAVDGASVQKWYDTILLMLSASPHFHSFQLYVYSSLTIKPTVASAAARNAAVEKFLEEIVRAHGARLTKFALQRMYVSHQLLGTICRNCPALKQLYVGIRGKIDVGFPLVPVLSPS